MPRAPRTLFLLGFLTLFLELALIRYLGGNVWNLGYFPNLVLLAVFVGMGVGFVLHQYLSPAASRHLYLGAAFVLAGLVGLVTIARPGVPGFEEWAGDVGGELFFTATPESQEAGFGLFVLWFVAVVVLFFAIAQRTAKVFRTLAPLDAYTWDIGGSIAGIVAFMLASWFELPAFVWFAAALPLFLAAGEGPWRVRWLAAAPIALALLLARQQDTHLLAHPEYAGPFELAWSPYQRVEYVDAPRTPHRVYVNGIVHQTMFAPAESGGLFYQVPHDLRRRAGLPPYRNVLVIGAGSGNDVAWALANGAEHVDAIEIDPVIARLGRRHHPARPYDDTRVTLVVDDARAFMTRTPRRYDLVIFALTDSLVKVSSMAQLRLENYLFTADSIRRAYDLLTETGEILLYNHYRREWLVEKFRAMVHAATGKYPRDLHRIGDDFKMLLVGRATGATSAPSFRFGRPTIPTDDWPFPYLKDRGIPPLYLGALVGLATVIAGLMVLLGRAGAGGAGLATTLAFVFMGGAFLLLETKSIVQFSLLFGTTWLNTSLVLLAILSLVLAANWTASLLHGRWVLPAAFVLLLASCLATLVFPLRGLLAIESTALRFVLASLMTFSAIYFANVIFSVAFRDQVIAEQLFGWNLLGAAAGGIVEYTSMAVGYDALAVLVAVCYALAFALLVLARRVPGAALTGAPLRA